MDVVSLFAENTNVIQVSNTQAFIALILFVAAIAGAWATLKSTVKHIETGLFEIKGDLRNTIKPDIKDVRERLATLEGKSAGLFNTNSPVKLTPKGTEALIESGLKEYIDENKDMLLGACSEKGSMETPYDVQESVMNFFREYQFPKEIENKLKTYAYNDGTSMEAMRQIAGIYFRDMCLEAHGFHPTDLDKPKSS